MQRQAIISNLVDYLDEILSPQVKRMIGDVPSHKEIPTDITGNFADDIAILGNPFGAVNKNYQGALTNTRDTKKWFDVNVVDDQLVNKPQPILMSKDGKVGQVLFPQQVVTYPQIKAARSTTGNVGSEILVPSTRPIGATDDVYVNGEIKRLSYDTPGTESIFRDIADGGNTKTTYGGLGYLDANQTQELMSRLLAYAQTDNAIDTKAFNPMAFVRANDDGSSTVDMKKLSKLISGALNTEGYAKDKGEDWARQWQRQRNFDLVGGLQELFNDPYHRPNSDRVLLGQVYDVDLETGQFLKGSKRNEQNRIISFDPTVNNGRYYLDVTPDAGSTTPLPSYYGDNNGNMFGYYGEGDVSGQTGFPYRTASLRPIQQGGPDRIAVRSQDTSPLVNIVNKLLANKQLRKEGLKEVEIEDGQYIKYPEALAPKLNADIKNAISKGRFSMQEGTVTGEEFGALQQAVQDGFRVGAIGRLTGLAPELDEVTAKRIIDFAQAYDGPEFQAGNGDTIRFGKTFDERGRPVLKAYTSRQGSNRSFSPDLFFNDRQIDLQLKSPAGDITYGIGQNNWRQLNDLLNLGVFGEGDERTLDVINELALRSYDPRGSVTGLLPFKHPKKDTDNFLAAGTALGEALNYGDLSFEGALDNLDEISYRKQGERFSTPAVRAGYLQKPLTEGQSVVLNPEIWADGIDQRKLIAHLSNSGVNDARITPPKTVIIPKSKGGYGVAKEVANLLGTDGFVEMPNPNGGDSLFYYVGQAPTVIRNFADFEGVEQELVNNPDRLAYIIRNRLNPDYGDGQVEKVKRNALRGLTQEVNDIERRELGDYYGSSDVKVAHTDKGMSLYADPFEYQVVTVKGKPYYGKGVYGLEDRSLGDPGTVKSGWDKSRVEFMQGLRTNAFLFPEQYKDQPAEFYSLLQKFAPQLTQDVRTGKMTKVLPVVDITYEEQDLIERLMSASGGRANFGDYDGVGESYIQYDIAPEIQLAQQGVLKEDIEQDLIDAFQNISRRKGAGEELDPMDELFLSALNTDDDRAVRIPRLLQIAGGVDNEDVDFSPVEYLLSRGRYGSLLDEGPRTGYAPPTKTYVEPYDVKIDKTQTKPNPIVVYNDVSEPGSYVAYDVEGNLIGAPKEVGVPAPMPVVAARPMPQPQGVVVAEPGGTAGDYIKAALRANKAGNLKEAKRFAREGRRFYPENKILARMYNDAPPVEAVRLAQPVSLLLDEGEPQGVERTTNLLRQAARLLGQETGDVEFVANPRLAAMGDDYSMADMIADYGQVVPVRPVTRGANSVLPAETRAYRVVDDTVLDAGDLIRQARSRDVIPVSSAGAYRNIGFSDEIIKQNIERAKSNIIYSQPEVLQQFTRAKEILRNVDPSKPMTRNQLFAKQYIDNIAAQVDEEASNLLDVRDVMRNAEMTLPPRTVAMRPADVVSDSGDTVVAARYGDKTGPSARQQQLMAMGELPADPTARPTPQDRDQLNRMKSAQRSAEVIDGEIARQMEIDGVYNDAFAVLTSPDDIPTNQLQLAKKIVDAYENDDDEILEPLVREVLQVQRLTEAERLVEELATNPGRELSLYEQRLLDYRDAAISDTPQGKLVMNQLESMFRQGRYGYEDTEVNLPSDYTPRKFANKPMEKPKTAQEEYDDILRTSRTKDEARERLLEAGLISDYSEPIPDPLGRNTAPPEPDRRNAETLQALQDRVNAARTKDQELNTISNPVRQRTNPIQAIRNIVSTPEGQAALAGAGVTVPVITIEMIRNARTTQEQQMLLELYAQQQSAAQGMAQPIQQYVPTQQQVAAVR